MGCNMTLGGNNNSCIWTLVIIAIVCVVLFCFCGDNNECC